MANPKYQGRRKIESILGEDNFFDKQIEIENLIPYRVWEKVVKDIIKDKPNKEIQMKATINKIEESFDNELNKHKIGELLKKYLIEPKKGQPNYFKETSIGCLGEDKKTVMEYAIQAISELNMQLTDFPKEAQSLIESIKKFIETSNKRT